MATFQELLDQEHNTEIQAQLEYVSNMATQYNEVQLEVEEFERIYLADIEDEDDMYNFTQHLAEHEQMDLRNFFGCISTSDHWKEWIK